MREAKVLQKLRHALINDMVRFSYLPDDPRWNLAKCCVRSLFRAHKAGR
jgi:hypothetical protein